MQNIRFEDYINLNITMTLKKLFRQTHLKVEFFYS